MNAMDRECILEFARCDMNLSETGRKMYVHKNTVQYHFDRVQKATGLDPRKFIDLVELLTRIQKGEYDEKKETELSDQ